MPETGLSHNYAADACEWGMSTAVRHDNIEKEVGSAVWFAEREKVDVEGIMLPYPGSDGEALILPTKGIDLLD